MPNPRHRSFQTPAARGEEPAPPLSFDLDGESFDCAPEIPGSLLIEHATRLGSSDVVVAGGELLAMWRDVLAADEYDRFRKFIDDPARRVTIQLLGEMLRWVVTELTGRPTTAPSPSPRGQAATGATSASSPAVTGSTPPESPPTS